jgi:hypothetical protein
MRGKFLLADRRPASDHWVKMARLSKIFVSEITK